MVQVSVHGQDSPAEPAVGEGVLAVVAVTLLLVALALGDRFVCRYPGVDVPDSAVAAQVGLLEIGPQFIVLPFTAVVDDRAQGGLQRSPFLAVGGTVVVRHIYRSVRGSCCQLCLDSAARSAGITRMAAADQDKCNRSDK